MDVVGLALQSSGFALNLLYITTSHPTVKLCTELTSTMMVLQKRSLHKHLQLDLAATSDTPIECDEYA